MSFNLPVIYSKSSLSPAKTTYHLQTGVYTVLYFLEELPFRGIYVYILLRLFLCKS